MNSSSFIQHRPIRTFIRGGGGRRIRVICWLICCLAIFALPASAIVLQADDNCCNTPGWHCRNNDEWIAGYYASRANECGVSASATVNGQSAPAAAISSAPAQTSTDSSTVSQPVNNCCYIGWQCGNNDEWIAGYYAFQANECGVSASATVNGQSAPAAAISSAPAQTSTDSSTVSQPVNNCCYIGWQCGNNDEWIAGYYAFQANQCETSSLARAVENQQARTARQNQQAGGAGSQTLTRVTTVDPETGKSTHEFKNEEGVTQVIIGPPTQSEICDALRESEDSRPLPEYC